VLDIDPGQAGDDEHRRKQERQAGDHQSGPPRPAMAEMHGELGGGRPRDQVRCAEQVDEVGVVEPAAPSHELVAHHRDVPGRTPERRQADAKEDGRELGESSALDGVGRGR
jgi:hypothetical protein